MADTSIDNDAVITVLNKILETELAGVVRYTHYSFSRFAHSDGQFTRLPPNALIKDGRESKQR